MRALLVAACCIALAACAAGGQQKMSAAPSTSGAAPEAAGSQVMPPRAHDQIVQLSDDIDASRMKLQLAEPSDAELQGVPTQPMGALPATQDPKCRPAQTDTCKTSCTLSDSICSNADKICTLAKDMAGDNWAQNKCAKANKTCEASKTKCCGCQ